MSWGLSDLAALMDRWGTWKEVHANADKVPALEQRIAALEERLQRAPGDTCPKCGALECRTEKTERSTGPFSAVGHKLGPRSALMNSPLARWASFGIVRRFSALTELHFVMRLRRHAKHVLSYPQCSFVQIRFLYHACPIRGAKTKT